MQKENDSKNNQENSAASGQVQAGVNASVPQKSVYAEKKMARRPKKKGPRRDQSDEFEQRILDIARVTRVMAGGKRMRFRACVAIGNRKGKVGIGLDKGADVTIAVTKAVNDAKKHLVDVPMANDTIPHEIMHKYGAAKVLLKPAAQGKGVIAGGVVRTILELSGLKNATSKILGTNNKINVAKCTISALESLKKVESKKNNSVKKEEIKKEENGPKKEESVKKEK
jgi:small subunit ribosomal protein S5